MTDEQSDKNTDKHVGVKFELIIYKILLKKSDDIKKIII